MSLPWVCQNEFCLSKPGWRLSIFGVVGCSGCNSVEPWQAGLIVASGGMDTAPLVLAERRTTPADNTATKGRGR